jgi:hypothetical protein
MDYSDINNLLGNLELDNQNQNQTQNQTVRAYKYDGQPNDIHELNKSNFKKKTKSDNDNIDMNLNRNIQLMNDIGVNRINLETINPQRNLVFNSKNSNTNFSKLEQERNQQMYTHNNDNLHIIDYTLFSDNYKNRDKLEQDDINNKLGSRENTPNIAFTNTHGIGP